LTVSTSSELLLSNGLVGQVNSTPCLKKRLKYW